MTEQDRDALQVELARRLRARGEWGSAEPLPADVLSRWMNGVQMPESGTRPDGWSFLGLTYQDAADELMIWWEQAHPNLRHYVLHDLTPIETTAEPPAWWPVYEQWLDSALRPRVDSLTDPANYGGVHPGWDNAIDFLMRVVGLRREEAWAFAADRKPLRVLPLHSESTVHPYGARIVITVMSPFVEPQAVADLYERVSQRIRGESAKPPNIKPESVRFYFEYDRLVRAFPRDKQARLEALPEELRGNRSANSAAAYFGKLKKSLLEAFEPGGVTWKKGDDDA